MPNQIAVKQFDWFEATFSPVMIDDLRSGAENLIGQRLVWQAVWIIEAEEPYADEWACSIYCIGWESPPPFAWVPLSDLSNVVMLPDFRPCTESRDT